jgi:site-specific recombinase XerD
VLFNFAVKKEKLEKNPVEKIDRPTVPFSKPHVLSPSDFEKLLRLCVRNKWHDRLAVFVLVGFCGIRVEESSRLLWSNLHLHKGIVEVSAEIAKKAAFRNNVIPPNAMSWLRLIEDKRRTGPSSVPIGFGNFGQPSNEQKFLIGKTASVIRSVPTDSPQKYSPLVT